MSVPQRTEPREALGGKAEAILAGALDPDITGGEP